jgi:hypothetical protein
MKGMLNTYNLQLVEAIANLLYIEDRLVTRTQEDMYAMCAMYLVLQATIRESHILII